MVSDNVLRVYRPPLPGKIDAFARIASPVKIAFRRVLFQSGTAREQNQCQLPAWQLSLKTTNIHYSIIEGCRFLEHITSEKNVINLECKFAFINLMVAIHTTIKKISKHEKNRAEIRAADFSLEFRLKTSLQKMCLSAKLLASLLRRRSQGFVTRSCPRRLWGRNACRTPKNVSVGGYKVTECLP